MPPGETTLTNVPGTGHTGTETVLFLNKIWGRIIILESALNELRKTRLGGFDPTVAQVVSVWVGGNQSREWDPTVQLSR